MKGIHKLPNGSYDRMPAARWSMVKSVLDCPAAYLHRLHTASDGSRPKDLGSLVHAMVLEPEKVEYEFLRAEKVDRRTKVGKAAWAALQEEAGPRDLIDSVLYDQALELSSALRKVMEVEFPGWREKALVEIAVFGKIGGIDAKCRIDLVIDGEIWDIKTTRDIRPRAFMGSCVKFGYYGQLATYKRLLSQFEEDVTVGGIIAIQTNGAPIAHVLRFNERAKAFGESRSEEAWKLLKKCRKSGEWPGYDYDGEIGIPDWIDEEA